MGVEPADTNEFAMKTAKRLGVDDAVFVSAVGGEQMVRFANDSLTVAKNISETVLLVYLAKDGKRIVGSSSNPTEAGVRRFVEGLAKTMGRLTREPYYAPLPRAARRFSSRVYDKRLERAQGLVPQFAAEAIDSARSAGGKRSAGAVEASVTTHNLLTSSGTVGTEKASKILLNIRSFTDADASGHGLSCSSSLKGFNPAEAGRRAGLHSKDMRNSKRPEEGTYKVLVGPTVASNLVSLVGGFASAFAVDAGTSYLIDKLGKKVASESITLTDKGTTEGGLCRRSFDDEGLPTQSTNIIEKGVLRNYLHNLTTARKFGGKSTGNAGWIEPSPWNLEVQGGDSSYDEMVSEMGEGIILTSNWYTRFTNYRTGEFSTVPRDGAYLVKGGEVKGPVSGLRMSDTLERLFSSVRLLSKEREWIEWWEVDTPTLCPWLLVDGVRITRAHGLKG